MLTIPPSNKLLYCCSPILNHLKPFLNGNDSEIDNSDYHAIFKCDFIELENRAFAMQIDNIQMQHLKYAMSALVDESILHSHWQGKFVWQGQPLQLEYFAEHLAGEGFFSRLELLRQNSTAYCDLLEIYYICLQLGFAGIYRLRGQEFLQALQVGLYQQIINMRKDTNAELNEQSLDIHYDKKIEIDLPYWIIPLTLLFIIFIIYFSYLIDIDNMADKTEHQLQQYIE